MYQVTLIKTGREMEVAGSYPTKAEAEKVASQLREGGYWDAVAVTK